MKKKYPENTNIFVTYSLFVVIFIVSSKLRLEFLFSKFVSKCNKSSKNKIQKFLLREGFKKNNREYNVFGTKGGRVSDLNHYYK